MEPNGPGRGADGASYSTLRDPTRRPYFCYASLKKEARSNQEYKPSNSGFGFFEWRTTQNYGKDRTGLQVGSWKKGRPDAGRFSKRDSGLYPFLDKDILLYGDGGWHSGTNDPGYYLHGPRKEDTRKESHGLLFSSRQPFLSGEHIEKNDWNLSRRENKRGRGSYGVPDESDVQSVATPRTWLP